MDNIEHKMEKTDKSIGAINLITLDFIYSDIPKIPALGEEVNTNKFAVSLGGGPVASLITAARLGAQTKLATCLGEDIMSGIGKIFLEQEKVNYRNFCRNGVSVTPVNISSVMTFAGSDRSFVSYFPDTDFYKTGIEEKFEYLKDTSLCIASEPCKELLSRLYHNGCRLAYDVGWSDELNIEDLKDILRYVYLFTPNDKEAMKLTDTSTPETALERLADFVEQPIVKLGKYGALVWYNGKIVHVCAADFVAVDSTGAGDAFLGGVVYGLSQGWDILECVRLGNYTGGNATTAVGCLTARSTLANYQRYSERCY